MVGVALEGAAAAGDAALAAAALEDVVGEQARRLGGGVRNARRVERAARLKLRVPQL